MDPVPRVAFLHGGLHTGRCWADTQAVVAALRPDIDTMVVDLPGRRSVPGDLATLTIDDCVSALADQIIEHAAAFGDQPLVLVGHSLAGVFLSGVVNQLGTNCVSQVIFVACCVPATGECVLDTLPFGMKGVVGRLVGTSPMLHKFPPGMVRYFFGNCATAEHRAKIQAEIVPESSALVTEVVLAEFPDSVKKSWVLTLRDRALPRKKQRAFIRNVGGVDDVVPMDTGHEVMMTHPDELARVLVQLVDARRMG
jgi:alpha-beta hydrolase superfamily lysophospholipase